MADSVKDLVVRLSFQHGDTKSQISAIKSELKLLDSEFKATAAQAGGFSASLNRSAAQAATLEKKISLQQQAVDRYQTALKQAEDRVKQTSQRHEEYGRKLEEAKQKTEECRQSVEDQKAALQELADAGMKNTSVYAEESARLDQLKEEYQQNQAEVKNLEGTYAKSGQAIANADKRVQQLTTDQNNARAAQAGMERELEQLNQRVKNHADVLEAASTKLKGYSEAAKSAGQWQTNLGRALSRGSALIASAGAAATGAAISWESDFAGVKKTVNGTAEELAQIEEQLLDMGEVKSASYSDLAGIAANAGQLGIATENVVDFTGTMADLAQTTDLTADAASTAFAQYANITQMSQDNIDRLGSVTVALGNNLATTESKTVDFATAIAAAGSQAGMTDAQIFGLAGGLSSLGLEAQAGGTAFSKAIIGMQVAVETGSEDMQKYAAVAGLSAEEFARAFREDASGAFIQFVQGLSSGSQSAIVMLDEMGVTETRLRDTLLRASNASDLLTRSVALSNTAWAENTALTDEAAVRYGTAASRMQMLGNKAQRAAISFGNSLLPVFEDGMNAVEKIVDKFSALDEAQRRQIITWGAYAAAAGPAITLIGKANSGIGTVTGALSKMFASMATGGVSLSSVAGGVAKLLGPAGIAALAVGAGVAAYKFYDWASGAKAAREAMEDMIDTAKEWSQVQATTLYDSGASDPLARFGLSADSFASAEEMAQGWMDELIAVWTDGQRETDEQVQRFIDRFVEAGDGARTAIQERGSLLEGLGALDDGTKEQMEADLQQLDAWDAEIEALLKKRQNGMLTDEDTARLDEVLKLRAELEFSYTGGSADGYQTILDGMQAEVDRLAAAGSEAGADLYGDALNALAEGRKAYNDSLADSYDAQHAQIMAIEDEATRTAALAALNEQYNARRMEGEQAYQQAVKEAATATWENTGMREQVQQIDQLAQMLGDPNLDPAKLAEWTQGLDEGALASMLTLVEQLKSSGATDSELAALGIDADDLYSKLQQIKDLTAGNELFSGLNEMIGSALPEEIQRVLVGLDMTQAAEDWAAFMEGKESFSTEGTVSIAINPLDQQTITAWETANANVELTGPVAKLGVALGANWATDLQTALDAGLLTVYSEDGVIVPVTPEVVAQLTGNDLVALDEDGTYHVIITPEVGSVEALAATTQAMESTPLDGTILAPLAQSTQEQVAQINSYATQISGLRGEIDQLKASGDAFNASGLALNELQDLENSSSSVLLDQLMALTDEDLDSIAGQAANLMAALNSGELDSATAAEYTAQLQELLGVIAVADQYLGTGNMISAGIAQGMAAYGWSGDAATLAESIQSAINSAMGIASPAQRMVPTGEFTAAGIAQGMTAFSFAAAAAAVAGSVTGGFSGMERSGYAIGANFGKGLSSGLQARMRNTLALAQSYASQITAAFRNAWQIHSPSRVAEGLTDMFGKGLEAGMKDWPSISERMLENDLLAGRQALGSVVNQSTDSRDFSVTSNLYVDKLQVRDQQDLRALAIELNALAVRDQRGKGVYA